MINTILFDLDGTLLSMDTDEFIQKYFGALSLKLKDHFSTSELVKYFMAATNEMIANTEASKTNEQVFFDNFRPHTNGNEEIIYSLMDEFYRDDFNLVKDVSKISEHIVLAIKHLKEKGYNLVVATNPLFPITAIKNRIEWAGLDHNDFSFITSFEDMHYCKPQIDYYHEILEKIDTKPQHCLMIGNNVDEDMIAKEIGINTYLITDHIIGDINDNKNIDEHGDYEDFYNFIVDLPTL